MKLHIPVLLQQTIDLLGLESGQIVLDCTAGYGGHAEAILSKIGPSGHLILVDRDTDALSYLRKKFASHTNIDFLHSNFAELNWDNIPQPDRILLDLGVSSPQLDTPTRGFSFSKDARLDMRMDTTQAKDALEIVNGYDESDIASIIYKYGEESRSRQIAKAIVLARSVSAIASTTELASIVSGALPGKTKVHPATKTFQAIRIEVNAELYSLERVLPMASRCLKSKGIMAIISFHSLEDRIVKQYFKRITNSEKDYVTGMEIGTPNFRLVNKKPVKGSKNDNNPRARSAMLRAVEKIN